MLIQVTYDDGRLGRVKPHLLDILLEGENVTSFLRSDGWAVVGRDIIRSRRSSQGYDGAERRACYTSGTPAGEGGMMRSLREVAWIVGVLALVSILLSGLL
jgi:hypothetical protein